MEHLHYFLASLLTLLIPLLTIYLVQKKIKTSSSIKLPPGPPRLPFIGNLLQLAVAGVVPHRGLHQLAKKYGPLMYLRLGEIPTVVISSSEAAKEVMKTHDAVFASRPSILVGEVFFYDSTDIAFSKYGDYWRKLRNIAMLELLSPKRVLSFRHIREEVVTECMKSIAKDSGSTIDLTEKIFQTSNSIIARTAFGITNAKDQEAFAKIIGETIQVASESGAADMFPSIKLIELVTGVRKKMVKMFEKTDKLIDNIISDHRAKRKIRKKIGESDQLVENEEEDLVDVLLKFEDDPDSEFSLTTNNIKAVLLGLWCAAIDTSAGTIEWAMAELLQNPDIMLKAQAEVRQAYQGKGIVDESIISELKFLKLVIKETLRLHPPLPLLLPRESSYQCQILGYEIPPKTTTMINAWAIGRDPKVWVDPDKFNPERFMQVSIDYKGTNYELIPFGGGRRMCPGMSSGLMVVEIQLAMLLNHFDWKLSNKINPSDLDMSESFGISAKRKNVLHVIPLSHYL